MRVDLPGPEAWFSKAQLKVALNVLSRSLHDVHEIAGNLSCVHKILDPSILVIACCLWKFPRTPHHFTLIFDLPLF